MAPASADQWVKVPLRLDVEEGHRGGLAERMGENRASKTTGSAARGTGI